MVTYCLLSDLLPTGQNHVYIIFLELGLNLVQARLSNVKTGPSCGAWFFGSIEGISEKMEIVGWVQEAI
jgi:hypothetical protein